MILNQSCIVKTKNQKEFNNFLIFLGKKTDFTWADGEVPSKSNSHVYKTAVSNFNISEDNPVCFRLNYNKKQIKVGDLGLYEKRHKELLILNYEEVYKNPLIRRF